MGNQRIISDEQIELLDQGLKKMKANNLPAFYQALVDEPFKDRLLTTSIDLGIVVLLLVDDESHTVNRVALSATEHAQGAVKVSALPFHEIKIPLSDPHNSIAKSIRSNQHQLVEDWQWLFCPILKPEEARLNQKAASIECSLVMPLQTENQGALIFSFYQPPSYISEEHIEFARKYAGIVSKRLKKTPPQHD